MNTEEKRELPLLGQLRECALRLDREGRWLHEGVAVSHEGLCKALHRWIDRDEESGRYVVRAGQQWCYIEVDDAPFVVRKILASEEGDQLRIDLRLSDDTQEELDYGTLRQDQRNVLYCDVKGGRFPARFGRQAYFDLAQRLELVDEEPLLCARGRRWPIAQLLAGGAARADGAR
jgi:hypothetical protein